VANIMLHTPIHPKTVCFLGDSGQEGDCKISFQQACNNFVFCFPRQLTVSDHHFQVKSSAFNSGSFVHGLKMFLLTYIELCRNIGDGSPAEKPARLALHIKIRGSTSKA
jgi:hypothetical protein